MVKFSSFYIFAGLYNFSLLLFNRFFTYDISKYDNLFSTSGIIVILALGLIYMSVYNTYEKIRLTNFAFFLAKLAYFIHWLRWFSLEKINAIYSEDFISGVLFSIYGIGDLMFGLFFLYIGINTSEKNKKTS